jgi:hypothetical protein
VICDICGRNVDGKGWYRALTVRTCWPCWDMIPEIWRNAIHAAAERTYDLEHIDV